MKKIAVILSVLVMLTVAVLPAFATDWMPSVESKDTPFIVEPEVEEEDVVAVIYEEEKENYKDNKDANHNDDYDDIVTRGELIVTSYARRAAAKTEDAAVKSAIKKNLEDAADDLSKGKYLNQIGKDLDKAADRIHPGAHAGYFVVRDIYDVTITGDLKDDFKANVKAGKLLKVTLDFNLSEGEPTPAFIYKPEGSTKWKLVKDEFVYRNADNTISFLLSELCAFAALTVPADVVIDPDIPSPVTGNAILAVSAAAFAAAGVAVAVLKKKKED